MAGIVVDYKVLIRHPTTGVALGELNTSGDIQSIQYNNLLNAPGFLQIKMSANNPKASLITTQDTKLDVYRRIRDADTNTILKDWYIDFRALYQAKHQEFDTVNTLVITAPGTLSLLGRYYNFYAANTTNKTAFTNAKAETIMKTLVKYNCDSSFATTGNGRFTSIPASNVSTETDLARGNTLDWNNFAVNVLENLQKLAQVAVADFDLVPITSTTYEFRYYPVQKGSDLRSSFLFAVERKNITNVVYEYNPIDEKTLAVVGGQGQDTDRSFVVLTGVNYTSTNYKEVFIDSRNDDTTAKMTTTGNVKLRDMQAQQKFSFKVLQTTYSYYGINYNVGDLVRAKRLDGVLVDMKITGAKITQNDQGNSIDIVLSTYNTS